MHVAARFLAYLALAAPFAAAARTPWDGARLAVSPEAADPYVTTPLFSGLALHHRIVIEAEPATPNLLVIENHAQEERRSQIGRAHV